MKKRRKKRRKKRKKLRVYMRNKGCLCEVKGCDLPAQKKLRCIRHYDQLWRARRRPSMPNPPKPTVCQAPWCGKAPVSKGYCEKHARQIKLYWRLTPEREVHPKPKPPLKEPPKRRRLLDPIDDIPAYVRSLWNGSKEE